MAEGPGPRPPPLPRGDDPTHRTGPPRRDYESVDLEEVEMPPSVEEIRGIDIDIEDGNVEKLLAITGENWSIDTQRETLKEAAKNKDERPKEPPPPPSTKPALKIPTPYDFGGSDGLVADRTGPQAVIQSEEEAAPPPLRA